MISTRRVLQMARRWKRAAVLGRRRISMGRMWSTTMVDNSSKMPASKSKGSFVVYTTDEKRFVIPLTFLSSPIMMELFRMSEDEFGLESNQPITIPCDGVLMEYILSMIQRRMHEDAGEGIAFPHVYSSLLQFLFVAS